MDFTAGDIVDIDLIGERRRGLIENPQIGQSEAKVIIIKVESEWNTNFPTMSIPKDKLKYVDHIEYTSWSDSLSNFISWIEEEENRYGNNIKELTRLAKLNDFKDDFYHDLVFDLTIDAFINDYTVKDKLMVKMVNGKMPLEVWEQFRTD